MVMRRTRPDPLAMLDDVGPGGDFLDDLLGGEEGPTGPSQMNPVDPIDDLLPPLGEDEDPFFHKPKRWSWTATGASVSQCTTPALRMRLRRKWHPQI